MFQSVVLSVSSDVITFHHGRKGRERAWEMNREKWEKRPDGIHRMEHTRQRKKGKKYYAEWGASCL